MVQSAGRFVLSLALCHSFCSCVFQSFYHCDYLGEERANCVTYYEDRVVIVVVGGCVAWGGGGSSVYILW